MSKYGEVRLAESWRVALILLFGGRAEHRRLAKILAARQRRPALPGERRWRYPVWLCGYCSETRIQQDRFCGECGSGMKAVAR